jgi:hypothetical protein
MTSPQIPPRLGNIDLSATRVYGLGLMTSKSSSPPTLLLDGAGGSEIGGASLIA